MKDHPACMTHLVWTKQWTFQPAFTVRDISVQGVQRRNLILELLERDGLKISPVPPSLSIYCWGISASMERKGFERVFHFRQRRRKEETAASAAGKRIQMTMEGAVRHAMHFMITWRVQKTFKPRFGPIGLLKRGQITEIPKPNTVPIKSRC